MASREEMIAELRRQDMIAQLRAMDAQQTEPTPEPAAQPEGMTETTDRGIGQALLGGLTAGFGDELVGAARAGIDVLTGANRPYDFGEGVSQETQPLSETYAMYRDEARDIDRQFGEESPGLSTALRVGAAFANPLNRVLPGLGATGGAGSRLAQSAVRGAAEGALAGFGEGEGTLEEQLQAAGQGARTGAMFSAGLTGIGGGLGRALSNRRVRQRLDQQGGGFMPLSLADDGVIGNIYRDTIGRAWGGKGVLKAQERPFVEAADEAVDRAGSFLERSLKQSDDNVVSAAINRSIPSTMPAKEASRIRNLDPQDAEAAISKWFRDDGFKSVKGRDFVFDPQLRSRISDMLDASPELKNEVGSALGSIDDLNKALNPRTGDSIAGDALMEIRNTFARTANAPMPSLRGLGNRTVAQEFDAMIGRQLGTDSPEFLGYIDELASWGDKQALSKSARQARKAGTDITARQLGRNAPDRGTLQNIARDARTEQVGLKRASKEAVDTAKEARKELRSRTTVDRPSGLSSLLTTAALGGVAAITPLGLIGTVPAGVGVARLATTKPVQRAVAGQTGWQRAMANALRKGDYAAYTRALSRAAAQQAAEEEEE